MDVQLKIKLASWTWTQCKFWKSNNLSAYHYWTQWLLEWAGSTAYYLSPLQAYELHGNTLVLTQQQLHEHIIYPFGTIRLVYMWMVISVTCISLKMSNYTIASLKQHIITISLWVKHIGANSATVAWTFSMSQTEEHYQWTDWLYSLVWRKMPNQLKSPCSCVPPCVLMWHTRYK